MNRIDRRRFTQLAAAFGATLACGPAAAAAGPWRERRDFYPQGVASGDPAPDSVILWTRRPPAAGSTARKLSVEVAEDSDFRRMVARGTAEVGPETGWTCRFLAAGLKPGREHFYRFADQHGFGSRIGRTLTAPAENDPRPVRFTFVSCQDVTQGACNAYRRMIFEDERRPPEERMGFVLHLGDFIYEVVWYPEKGRTHRDGRRLKDLFRYPTGQAMRDFHLPATLEDYRTVYAAYLTDPDLQDARARWPFVCMWDNHEFSWRGWQSQQEFGPDPTPAQQIKVAANQAWYEFQPARVVKAGGDRSLGAFKAPAVKNVALTKFDDHGLGLDPDNLAALDSLTVYRAFRYGRNVEMILTDNRSYASRRADSVAGAEVFSSEGFPYAGDELATNVIEAGRTYDGGKPPETIRFGGKDLPNPAKDARRWSILGARQSAWFLDRLRGSKAKWKVWGNSFGLLQWRVDYQNLPKTEGKPVWPGEQNGLLTDAECERRDLMRVVEADGITGLTSVCGDRHSFWAGTLSSDLPPRDFKPMGVEFITGSISAPGMYEVTEMRMKKDEPWRVLYLLDRPDGSTAPMLNFTARHGVKAALELAASGDPAKARAKRNPELAPQLSFVDMGGHGYAMVRASEDALDCEFVAIPRPMERNLAPDGGPLLYRVVHRVKPWRAGEAPMLEQRVLEGDPQFSI